MAKKRGGEAARETSGEQAPVVRIFLSSPGDVADERKIASELIERELQKHPSYRKLKLVVIAWVRHRFMDTPWWAALFQVVLGGVLVFLAGVLIGSS